MKKVLSLVLTVIFIFSLTGCADKAKSTGSTVSGDLKFAQIQSAPHGTKSFAVTTVVMQGDKIAIAYIDEFQVMPKDQTTGVPNSDGDFGAAFADPATQLGSKRVNTKYYSDHMKEANGATVTIDKNFDAIQEFAQGKTIAELEKAIDGKTAEQVVDAVSGATLVDTSGYLQAIIEAAKAAK